MRPHRPIIVAQGNVIVTALAPRRALGLGLSGVPDIDDPYFRIAFPFSTPAAGPVYEFVSSLNILRGDMLTTRDMFSWSPSGDGVHPRPRLVIPRAVDYRDTARECPPPLPKYRVVDLPDPAATPMPPVKEEMQCASTSAHAGLLAYHSDAAPTPPSTPSFTTASLTSTGHYVQSEYISGPQQGIGAPTAGAGWPSARQLLIDRRLQK
ncbi:hypothetical protein EXIGLDRAFT_733619 [Exidia glandulosa HHB12029]|uniref:Uncharacterized protein n=1 Tax=Exidia glandulosa HHB12029 TaxID=1314781 RepID=A0A165KFL6_EXIGL|nr:hypothetical protein EXIGLDRAFT_733619 [Exidia glandulosa HHB12029]